MIISYLAFFELIFMESAEKEIEDALKEVNKETEFCKLEMTDESLESYPIRARGLRFGLKCVGGTKEDKSHEARLMRDKLQTIQLMKRPNQVRKKKIINYLDKASRYEEFMYSDGKAGFYRGFGVGNAIVMGVIAVIFGVIGWAIALFLVTIDPVPAMLVALGQESLTPVRNIFLLITLPLMLGVIPSVVYGFSQIEFSGRFAFQEWKAQDYLKIGVIGAGMWIAMFFTILMLWFSFSSVFTRVAYLTNPNLSTIIIVTWSIIVSILLDAGVVAVIILW
jgi:hypothetical protein